MSYVNQKKVWDEIAVPWNEFRNKIPPTVINFLKGKKGKILDLGCGSGRNFKKIKNLEWYGVDFSDKMIELAKKETKKKKIEAEFIVADSDDTGFPDNYFDSVLCYAVLHCIDSPLKRKKTLKEIFRVLKPEGEALISSWGKKSPRLRGKGNQCFIPWTAREGKKVERYTYVFDIDELEELSKNAGFEIVGSWEERNVNLIIRKPSLQALK